MEFFKAKQGRNHSFLLSQQRKRKESQLREESEHMTLANALLTLLFTNYEYRLFTWATWTFHFESASKEEIVTTT